MPVIRAISVTAFEKKVLLHTPVKYTKRKIDLPATINVLIWNHLPDQQVNIQQEKVPKAMGICYGKYQGKRKEGLTGNKNNNPSYHLILYNFHAIFTSFISFVFTKIQRI